MDKPYMIRNISLRNSSFDDFEFVFNLNKINMKKYIDRVRTWDEEFERKEMRKNFSPEKEKIIQVNGIDAGSLRINEKPDSISLCHIELLPEYQNQGIGTFLIKNVIEDAKLKNKPLTLRVLKQNPAVNLYKRLGFSIQGDDGPKYIMSTEI